MGYMSKSLHIRLYLFYLIHFNNFPFICIKKSIKSCFPLILDGGGLIWLAGAKQSSAPGIPEAASFYHFSRCQYGGGGGGGYPLDG
jgi:hypothetical protein